MGDKRVPSPANSMAATIASPTGTTPLNTRDPGDTGWAHILSFLTIFEWTVMRHVSKRFNKLHCTNALAHFRTLDLSQFWAVLGDDAFKFTPAVLSAAIAKMTKLRSVSFAFCHNLTDQVLVQWLREIPAESKQNICHVNLYFARKLTNLSVLTLVKMFPSLKYLNLGSCFSLTDACASQIVKNAPHLRQLILSNNEKFTDEILIDLMTHPSLEILDVQRTKLSKETIDEYRIASPKLIILGPQVIVPAQAGGARLQKRASLQ